MTTAASGGGEPAAVTADDGKGPGARGAPLPTADAAPRRGTTDGDEVSGVVIGSRGRDAGQARLRRAGPAQRRPRRRRRTVGAAGDRRRGARPARASVPAASSAGRALGRRLAPSARRRARPRGAARHGADRRAIDLGDALAQIATALRIPVLIAAILVLLLCALELGRFAAEYWRRRVRMRGFDLGELTARAIAEPQHADHYAALAPGTAAAARRRRPRRRGPRATAPSAPSPATS